MTMISNVILPKSRRKSAACAKSPTLRSKARVPARVSRRSSSIRLEWEAHANNRHYDVKPMYCQLSPFSQIDKPPKKAYAAHMNIGTEVVVSAEMATTALIIPIIRLKDTLMPLPVARWAEGSTSGVYA